MSEGEAKRRYERVADVAELAAIPESQRTEAQTHKYEQAQADPAFKQDMREANAQSELYAKPTVQAERSVGTGNGARSSGSIGSDDSDAGCVRRRTCSARSARCSRREGDGWHHRRHPRGARRCGQCQRLARLARDLRDLGGDVLGFETGATLALLCLSWALIVLLPLSLWWLAGGILLLDLAVQAVHVTNQTLIVGRHPDAAGRIIAGYMVFYSVGSAAGAAESTFVYSLWGWNGVCLTGLCIALAGLMLWSYVVATGSNESSRSSALPE